MHEEMTTTSEIKIHYTCTPQDNSTFEKYIFSINADIAEHTKEITNPRTVVSEAVIFSGLVAGMMYKVTGKTMTGKGNNVKYSVNETLHITTGE